MTTPYAGSSASYPTNISLMDDGEPAAARIFNPPHQQLADRTAWLRALLVTREREGELAIATSSRTLTVDEQLVAITPASPTPRHCLVTLPDPALSVGRVFRIRTARDPLDATTPIPISTARLLPHGAETINGRGGFSIGASKVATVFTPDGVNWLASAEEVFPATEIPVVFAPSATGGPTGTTFQVYGEGFRHVTEVQQNGFEISTVGGSATINDDGWISITTGGAGAGEPVDLYDGSGTYYTGFTST